MAAGRRRQPHYNTCGIYFWEQFYHLHPGSSDWNELAFLHKMLDLGEETWVPALHPLELLSLHKKYKKKKRLKLKMSAEVSKTFNSSYKATIVWNYLRASKHKVRVRLHQTDHSHPASAHICGWSLHRATARLRMKVIILCCFLLYYMFSFFSFYTTAHSPEILHLHSTSLDNRI